MAVALRSPAQGLSASPGRRSQTVSAGTASVDEVAAEGVAAGGAVGIAGDPLPLDEGVAPGLPHAAVVSATATRRSRGKASRIPAWSTQAVVSVQHPVPRPRSSRRPGLRRAGSAPRPRSGQRGPPLPRWPVQRCRSGSRAGCGPGFRTGPECRGSLPEGEFGRRSNRRFALYRRSSGFGARNALARPAGAADSTTGRA